MIVVSSLEFTVNVKVCPRGRFIAELQNAKWNEFDIWHFLANATGRNRKEIDSIADFHLYCRWRQWEASSKTTKKS